MKTKMLKVIVTDESGTVFDEIDIIVDCPNINSFSNRVRAALERANDLPIFDEFHPDHPDFEE